MNAYSIRRRNERANEKKNQESLDFMQYVKSAPTEELRAAERYVVDWQRVAIVRELVRRGKR